MFSRQEAASKSYDFIHPPSREVLSMKFNDFQGGHPKNLIHDRNVEQNKFISEQITNDPSHVQRHADLQLKMRNPLFHEFHYKKLANLPEYQTKSYLSQQGQSPNSENPSDSLDIFQQNYAARQQNQQHSKQGSNLMNYDYSYSNNNNSTINPNDNPTNNNNKSLQLLPPQSSKNMNNPPLSRQSLNLPELPTNNNNNLPQPQVNLTSRYTPQQQQQPQQPYYQPQQFQRLSSQRRSQQYLGKNSMGTSSVHLDNNNQSEIDLPPRSRQNELMQLRSPQYQGKPYFNPQNVQPDMNNLQNPSGYLNDGYDNPQYQQQLQLQEQQYINQNNNSNSNNVSQQQQFQEQSSPGQIPQYEGNNNAILRREQPQNEPNQNGRYATPSILNDKKMRRMYNPLISKVSAVYEPRYGVEAHWDKYDREQFRNWENKSKDYIDIVKAKNYVLGKYAEYSTGNHEYGVKKE